MVSYFYRLLVTIRSKDRHGNRLPTVSYDRFVRSTESLGPTGGLELHGLVRRN